MPNAIDITGKKYGKLLVVSFGESKGRHRYWECVCDCGRSTLVRYYNLTSGHTNSCGLCSKHYMCSTQTYKSWSLMLDRCNNVNNNSYKDYGGRGIEVCESWHDFRAFLKDMGVSPKGMSIDRIDVNKGYHKGNCRWATNKQQANNKRNNKTMTHNGKTMTYALWAETIGVRQSTFHNWATKGMTIGDMLKHQENIRLGIQPKIDRKRGSNGRFIKKL